MEKKRRAWILIAAAAVLCGLAVFSAAWLRSRSETTLGGLLRRLPTDGAAVLYVDFAQVRQSGILGLLADSKVGVEPEYRTFVEQTGFDYKKDLDLALAAFRKQGSFFLLKGRFNWKSLNAYAKRHGGVCRNTLCRMPGSTPERRISFFPLRPDVMALAVSPDEWAVTHLQLSRDAVSIPVPGRPVWLYVPGSRLQQVEDFPSGTQLFIKAMQPAESLVLGVGPQGEGLEATMEVVCRSVRDAEVLQNQLEGITSVLKAIIASESQKPNTMDLSGVLTAGSFTRDDNRVLGRWPVGRAFLESLAGSS
jgi:hypothetical protein